MPRAMTFPRSKPSSIGSARRSPRYASATPSRPQPGQGGGDAADALARALDVPHATAAEALRRTNGDRDAAAAMILEQRQPAPPVEAEVLSWDNPIEATLVEEPRPAAGSLSRRSPHRMRGRLWKQEKHHRANGPRALGGKSSKSAGLANNFSDEYACRRNLYRSASPQGAQRLPTPDGWWGRGLA